MQEARVKIMRLVAWSMRALCALNGCFSCALHGCPVLYHLNCMVMHAESKVFGKWPTHDAWGESFNGDCPAHWIANAGSPLAGPFMAALDGFCGDLAYLYKLFEFKRFLALRWS